MSEGGTPPPRSGDEFVRDEAGEVVALGHRVDGDDDYWTDERFAEIRHLNEAARALAPSLVGLTVDGARNLVAQHPGLSVLFMYPGRGYRAIGVSGQISAFVRNDVVVAAS